MKRLMLLAILGGALILGSCDKQQRGGNPFSGSGGSGGSGPDRFAIVLLAAAAAGISWTKWKASRLSRE